MPNKPKIFKCVKPGCRRVFTKNADFVAHHGKCVLGVYDSLKCSSCGKGFSNSQYWKMHRRNCKPVKSLLLPLAERLKLAEEKKSPSKNHQSDEDVIDDDKDFNAELEEMLTESNSPAQQYIESDTDTDADDDNYEELNQSLGSNDSSSSKTVYVYSLVDPRSRIPSYTCVPSFEEKALDTKEDDKEDEDEIDEFIEEYLEDDDDKSNDDETRN